MSRRRRIKNEYKAKIKKLETFTPLEQDIYNRYSQKQNLQVENAMQESLVPAIVEEEEPASEEQIGSIDDAYNAQIMSEES